MSYTKPPSFYRLEVIQKNRLITSYSSSTRENLLLSSNFAKEEKS